MNVAITRQLRLGSWCVQCPHGHQPPATMHHRHPPRPSKLETSGLFKTWLSPQSVESVAALTAGTAGCYWWATHGCKCSSKLGNLWMSCWWWWGCSLLCLGTSRVSDCLFTTTFIKFYIDVSLVWNICGFQPSGCLAWPHFVPSSDKPQPDCLKYKLSSWVLAIFMK